MKENENLKKKIAKIKKKLSYNCYIQMLYKKKEFNTNKKKLKLAIDEIIKKIQINTTENINEIV